MHKLFGSFYVFPLVMFSSFAFGAEVPTKFQGAKNSGATAVVSTPGHKTNGGDFEKDLAFGFDGGKVTVGTLQFVKTKRSSPGMSVAVISNTSGADNAAQVTMPDEETGMSITNTSCSASGVASWTIDGSPWPPGTSTHNFDWEVECISGGGPCNGSGSLQSYDVSVVMEGAPWAISCGEGDRFCVYFKTMRSDVGEELVQTIADSCVLTP